MPDMTTVADVLALVRSGRASTRSDLQKTTGLSRTAVVSRVSALVDAGLILTGEELASTGGRPPGSLTFNADAGVVLAVAIGRSRSQLAVFDLDGRELAGDTRDHEVGIAADELMPEVTDRLEVLLEGIEPPVLGVGMSLPGVVDPARLVSVDSPVMHGWDGVALDPYFDRLTDGPLVLVNDTDALATAELFGSGLHPRDALVVKASTGLGLAVIAEGRVLRGHAGAVGEIGHTRVESAGDRPCRCGATGCLETVAAGWALTQGLVDSGVSAGHIRDLVAAALAGDAIARGLLREAGRQLGEVLAIAINLLNPEVVVIGGDMAAAFDLFTAGVRETVYARSTALATRDLTFVPSTHADSTGAVGCAAVVINHLLSAERLDAHLTAAK